MGLGGGRRPREAPSPVTRARHPPVARFPFPSAHGRRRARSAAAAAGRARGGCRIPVTVPAAALGTWGSPCDI
eukprot:3186341-Prymnesium_polylepis.1